MSFFDKVYQSKIQNVYHNKNTGVTLDVKREDQIHPWVSGNKFRKLKYNIQQAKIENKETILTYGGAFSNHIVATASAAKLTGLKSVGVIRGDEIEKKMLKNPEHNPTLAYAEQQGMKLHYVSRKAYTLKDTDAEISKLKHLFGSFYRIPEGGSNNLAVKGCEEILVHTDKKYDAIACCVGTGGTLAGLINSSSPHQQIYGFSALNNHKHDEIKTWTNQDNWQIIPENTFGGYAKTNDDLIVFINSFYRCTKIKLDPIYTGKMFCRLFDLIAQDDFSQQTKILAIHTGGLQGLSGFNQRQKRRGKAHINF